MGRYNHKKIILASTNYSFKEEATSSLRANRNLDEGNEDGFNPDRFGSLSTRVGKRIFSRLMEMSKVMEISGSDYRMTGQEAHIFTNERELY